MVVSFTTVGFIYLKREVPQLSCLQCPAPSWEVSPSSVLAQLRDHQLVLVVLVLENMLHGHRPFTRELSLLKELAGNEPLLQAPLEVLAKYGATGVATVMELRDSFGLILLPKLSPTQEAVEPSWIQNWWNNAKNLSLPEVELDKMDGSGGANQSLVSLAMDRLTEDDLAGAVALLNRLEGFPATVVARWLVEANARLALDGAAVVLADVAVERLARRSEGQ